MTGAPTRPIEPIQGGVRLHVLVQPRASVAQVTGVHDGRIKIRLTAPPVDGAANEALVRFLAEALEVPVGVVEIASGQNARRKTVIVRGVSGEGARQRLLGED